MNFLQLYWFLYLPLFLWLPLHLVSIAECLLSLVNLVIWYEVEGREVGDILKYSVIIFSGRNILGDSKLPHRLLFCYQFAFVTKCQRVKPLSKEEKGGQRSRGEAEE